MRYYFADMKFDVYTRYRKFLERWDHNEKYNANNLNILISYQYDNKRPAREELISKYLDEWHAGRINHLMVDSGCFALEKERSFNVPKFECATYADIAQLYQYLAFAERIKTECVKAQKPPPKFFAWDRDTRRCDEAFKNNERWLDKLIDLFDKQLEFVIPVIHNPLRSDYEPATYIDKKFPLISIGKVQEMPTKGKSNRVRYYPWVFQKIREAGLKSHLLGSGSELELSREAIHSSDSTSWLTDIFRQRAIKFLDPETKKILRIPTANTDKGVGANYNDLPDNTRTAFERWLKEDFKFKNSKSQDVELPIDLFFSTKTGENSRDKYGVNGPDLQIILSILYYSHHFSDQIETRRAPFGWGTKWPEEIKDSDVKFSREHGIFGSPTLAP